MTQRPCFLATILTILAVPACAGGGAESADAARDSAAIGSVLDERRTTLEKGDAPGWLTLWANDVRLIDPAGNDVVGRDALQSWAEPFFAQLRMQYTESVEELTISGGLALARVAYDFTTPRAGAA